MPQIDWNNLMNGQQQQRKRFHGANVRFFNSYNENKEKSLQAGRAIFDEIPSISIQYPGGDETVRKIEPQDVADYPEKYAAFKAGSEEVVSGTPLAEWTLMNGSTLRELQHLGFKTVEQLADAHDEVKRKLGPTGRFVKMAKDWLEAANSSQFNVVALKQQLEREQKRTAKLEEQVELLLQRVEGNEGIDLRPRRKEVIRSIEVEDELLEEGSQDEVLEEEAAPKRRGRPRKV
tara:strand:+ start:1119 stop:1817 length:699 start_codon:yes stop_codon:yes gene_type:complete